MCIRDRPYKVLQATGKSALAALNGCDGADVLITNMQDDAARPCLVFDVVRLRETGSLALDLGPEGDLQITSARDITGTRPWNAHALPRGKVFDSPLRLALNDERP